MITHCVEITVALKTSLLIVLFCTINLLISINIKIPDFKHDSPCIFYSLKLFVRTVTVIKDFLMLMGKCLERLAYALKTTLFKKHKHALQHKNYATIHKKYHNLKRN